MTDKKPKPQRALPRICEDDLMEGYTGICLECLQLQSPVEPDAEGETCPDCYQQSVWGAEHAILAGYLEVME